MRHGASAPTTVRARKFWTSSPTQQEGSAMFSVTRSLHRPSGPKKPTRRDLAQIRHDELRKVRYYPRSI
jgi:hypothetical protein